MSSPSAPPQKRKTWSFIEWVGVIAAAIAILGFLGYATIWKLLPIGALDSAILGEWQATDRPWHIMFRADKTIGMSTIGPLKLGTYRLDSNGTLWVDMQNGQHFRAAVRMPSHDQINLADPDGTLTSFQRVP